MNIKVKIQIFGYIQDQGPLVIILLGQLSNRLVAQRLKLLTMWQKTKVSILAVPTLCVSV